MNNSKVSAYGLMLVFCLLAKTTLVASAGADLAMYNVPSPISVSDGTYNETDIELRVSNMRGLIDMKYTSVVRDYIMRHIKHKTGTSMVLGRQSIYFPLFEEVLIKNNMPTDLKYLAIVESSLNPSAVSKSGAVGLWQIMRATGRMLGLKINNTVDERKSPYRSTEAAVLYLQQLHERFGSWELALAAYNCGPGNVNKAIRRGKSKDFWEIKRFLPKETRNYIPAFIAMNYLANYYYLHDMEPIYENTDFLSVSNMLVYDKISFKEITDITGASGSIIKSFNPSYLKRYIPGSEKGNYILLPSSAAKLLISHLYNTDLYLVDQLILAGDNTIVDFDFDLLERMKIERTNFIPLDFLKGKRNFYIKSEGSSVIELPVGLKREANFMLHKLGKRESLRDVAQMYNVALESLIQWNIKEDGVYPQPGHLVRLKK